MLITDHADKADDNDNIIGDGDGEGELEIGDNGEEEEEYGNNRFLVELITSSCPMWKVDGLLKASSQSPYIVCKVQVGDPFKRLFQGWCF